MVSLERLSAGNIEKFRILNVENLKMNTYDKNFFEYYDNENFFLKLIYKKFVKLFFYNGHIIGYIWYEVPLDTTIRIWSIYIKNDFINLLDENTLNTFNNNTLIYEATDTVRNNKLLSKLGFRKTYPSTLMVLKTDFYNKEHISLLLKYNLENNRKVLDTFNTCFNSNCKDIKISVEKMKVNFDEYLRCNLQNDIFFEENRTPLNIEDIENDINQPYYLNDLSLFLKINGVAIGYGQVIYTRYKYTVVNFGIIKEFRRFGFGKILLNSLIVYFKETFDDDLYIRVADENINAVKLYTWTGFTPKLTINNWERN